MTLTKVTNSMVVGAPINVKDYGAKGDATTDDTAAIQSALNAVSATGNCVYFPKGEYLITSSLSVSKQATYILGENPPSPSAAVRIKYTGLLDATLSMIFCTSDAQGFSIKNLYLNANDLAGYCLTQEGIGSPTKLTRGNFVSNITFFGYVTAAWVIGDSTDTLNSAQFQLINAESIRIIGSALGTNANGIHLNAQNCEFLNINGIYIDPTPGREHTNHIRQISGGLNIKGLISTRARTASGTGGFAIYSRDQVVINGWRTEDTLLLDMEGVGASPGSIINGLYHRRTLIPGATTVITVGHTDGNVRFDSPVINGTMTIESTTAKFVTVTGAKFVGAGAGFSFSGPQNTNGIFHDVSTGNFVLRGSATSIDLFSASGGTGNKYSFDEMKLTQKTSASASNQSIFVDSADGVLKFKDSGGVLHSLY